jgi:hypothetical protein
VFDGEEDNEPTPKLQKHSQSRLIIGRRFTHMAGQDGIDVTDHVALQELLAYGITNSVDLVDFGITSVRWERNQLEAVGPL